MCLIFQKGFFFFYSKKGVCSDMSEEYRNWVVILKVVQQALMDLSVLYCGSHQNPARVAVHIES